MRSQTQFSESPPLVSILIPVFNRQEYIGACINSARAQTFSNIEIVVVDNASTDGTWDVCERLARADQRVRIFRNKVNIGPARNWVACVSHAKGKYGKILYSDDLLNPQFIEHTLASLADDVAFVSTAARVGETEDRCRRLYVLPEPVNRLTTEQYLSQLLFKELGNYEVPYSPGAAIFRLSDIKENLLVDIPTKTKQNFPMHGAGPDVLLYALTSLKYRFVVMLSSEDVFFREHSASITVINRNHEVSDGYISALAWFCRSKLTLKDWSKFIARSWLIEIKKTRRYLGLRAFCGEFEGTGAAKEWLNVALLSLGMAASAIYASLRRSGTAYFAKR